jgi:hypothetical protein
MSESGQHLLALASPPVQTYELASFGDLGRARISDIVFASSQSFPRGARVQEMVSDVVQHCVIGRHMEIIRHWMGREFPGIALPGWAESDPVEKRKWRRIWPLLAY